MGYALRRDLHFAIIEDRALFLDIAADRYFRLPETLDAAFRGLVDGGEDLSDPGAIERLCGFGILVPHQGGEVPTTCGIATARSDFVFNGQVSAAEIVRSLSRQMNAIAFLKLWPLRSMIRNLARKKHSCMAHPALPDRAALTRIAFAYECSNVFVSTHERCLAKSCALAQSLLARGQTVDLVFGVQARPFAAHCWVQANDLVLNDTTDHIRTFAPIFSV